MPKLMILLEVAPEQIGGGYLVPRVKQLASQFYDLGWDVHIGSPGIVASFNGIPCKMVRSRSLYHDIQGMDCIIVFLSTHPHWIATVQWSGIPCVVDASNFPWLENKSAKRWRKGIKRKLGELILGGLMWDSVRIGKNFIVSHELQKELIHSIQHKAKCQLVPFHESELTIAARSSFHISSKYFICGGGLWPWFDYETLFQAIKNYKKLGGTCQIIMPANATPQFKDDQQAILRQIDEDETLKAMIVLISDWMPVDQWNYIVSNAIATINSQPDTLETKYSYRTRIKNSLRLKTPVLTTEGDYLSSLIKKLGMGEVHAFGDSEKLAYNMLQWERKEILRNTCVENIKEWLLQGEQKNSLDTNFVKQRFKLPIAIAIRLLLRWIFQFK